MTGVSSVGPYGEILPPPFTGGLHPDEVLKEMVGPDIFKQMSAAEREAFYGEAAIYAHQQRLARVFAGDTDGIEGGADLYRAAMAGASISLRPLGYEGEQYAGFAPVLHRLPDGRWRVGLPGKGRTVILDEPDGGLAYLAARALYVQWAQAEAAGL